MKKIKMIGLGPGNLEYLTFLGRKEIEKAEILIGGKRHLEEARKINKSGQNYELKKLNDMLTFIKENLDKNIAIVVSGDTGYYSLLNFLKRNDIDFDVVPGITSFQYLFSRIGESWEEYTLLSLHGRDENLIDIFKESKKGVVVLTDSKNTPISISEKFLNLGFSNIEVIVGENLSYSNEIITKFKIKDYKKYIKNYEMNVVILKK